MRQSPTTFHLFLFLFNEHPRGVVIPCHCLHCRHLPDVHCTYFTTLLCIGLNPTHELMVGRDNTSDMMCNVYYGPGRHRLGCLNANHLLFSMLLSIPLLKVESVNSCDCKQGLVFICSCSREVSRLIP